MAATPGLNIRLEIAPVATGNAAMPAENTFLPLVGRSTGIDISGDRTEADNEFGEADALWAKGSTVSGRGWTVPFDGYFKDTDAAFLLVEAAVMLKTRAGAAASSYLYIRVYPRGKVVGATVYRGVVTVDNFSHTFDRNGFLETSFGFTGEGEPITEGYVAPA